MAASRSLILLLLMTLLAPAAAGQRASSELYGEFRYFLGRADAGGSGHWATANNASRLGARGEITERGLTAFLDLQAGVNVDAEQDGGAFTQRFYLAGVRGAFGSLSVGRQSTAYKLAGLRLDPFYDMSTISTGGGVPFRGLFAGGSFGMSSLTNGWADRSVAYQSPRAGGFALNGEIFLGRESDHDFGLGLNYLAHGFDAGVQYFDHNLPSGLRPPETLDYGLRVHALYRRAGSWSAGASYERVQLRNEVAQSFVYVAATFHPIDRLLLVGAFGFVEDVLAGANPVSGRGFHIGAFHELLTRVRIHGLVSYLDRDSGSARSSVGVGLTYQFAVR